MADFNPFGLFDKIFKRHETYNAKDLKDPKAMSKEDIANFEKWGMTISELQKVVSNAVRVNFERHSFYSEIGRALQDPIIGAALELYADTVTRYSNVHNATVWVTGDNRMYINTLMSLFDTIGLEERIFNWAWKVGAYGDLWVKIHALPGKGIISIDDDFHPMDISRVDSNGRLLGFYITPYAGIGSTELKDGLIAPWEFVHMRLLGAKVKVPHRDDVLSTEYRTISLLGSDTRRASTKYGDSLLTNAIPIYKRYRLQMDTLLMSAVSKRPLKYVYKVGVDSSNTDGVEAIINSYAVALKRARAMNVTSGQESYQDRLSDLAGNEDIIIPVWGGTNNLEVEKLGGEADIKNIVDIQELRNQLACALRVPLPLLGGFTEDLPSSLGQSSLERLDIRFAQSAHRLQRALIEGITRICQIHLAFLEMSPDTKLFNIQMSETSSAEEEEIKAALKDGVDIVERLAEVINKFAANQVDQAELFNYLNTKILKLNDLDLSKMKIKLSEGEVSLPGRAPQRLANTDLKALLPTKVVGGRAINEVWEKSIKGVKISVKPIKLQD